MAAVDNRDGLQWRQWRGCLMAAAAFDGIQWHRQWTTTRGQEGGARRGNATTSQHDERTRGWCNKRMMRDDRATTSWRNKTTKGDTTRQRDNERAARQEATQQPASTTRGRVGGATRGPREAMRQPAGMTKRQESGTTRGDTIL